MKSKSSASRSSPESTVPLSASAPITTTYLLLSLALIQLLAACTRPELTRTDEVFSLVVAPAGDDNPRNSEGDIIVLKDGRLLLAYTEFLGSTSGDFEPARISARISSNGGKTWGKKLVLAENQEGLKNAMIGSLLRLADGRIRPSPNTVHLSVRVMSDPFCYKKGGTPWHALWPSYRREPGLRIS